MYGHGFRRANTYGKLLESTFVCIKPQVHIMSELAAIIILVQRSFSANGATTPYFVPLGRVSCWVQFGRVLGLEHDPASLWSSSHTYKTYPSSIETHGLCWLDLALATSAGDALLAKLLTSSFSNPNLIVFSAHIHLAIMWLFYLFLLVLRLLTGQVPSWLGCCAPQDHIDHGSWCIGR
jgi:hypothetical protein